LVNTVRKNFELEVDVITEMGGKAPSFEQYRSALFRGSWTEYYEQYGVDPERAIALYYEKLTYIDVEAIPGVGETLEDLRVKSIDRSNKGKKLKWSVVSLAKSVERVRKKLENARLERYFTDCNIHVTEADKSEAIIGELREHDVRPERAVIVGDTRIDVESGRKAGIITIGIANEYSFDTFERIREAKPDYIARSIKEIIGVIG